MPVTNRETPMRATVHNRLAAAYIREKRGGRSQQDFARQLSEVLGVGVSTSSLCYYEGGSKTIPGPVLLAVQQLARRRRSKP